MTTFMTEQLISANTRTSSPQFVLPMAISGSRTIIDINIVSASWTTSGSGTISWGVEISKDTGASWQVIAGTSHAIGLLNKGSIMPSIGLSRMDLQMPCSWRMWVYSDIAISIGFQGGFEQWQSLL